ncbi:MAG: transposase [Hyphomonas sp.]|nr:transposase [Hyphomonas sp.]
MIRHVLTDAQWAQLEPPCLRKKSDPGRTGWDGRLFVEAVLWIAPTGNPWRDLPAELGNWNAVFQRFRYRADRDASWQIFDVLSDDPDMEYARVDAAMVHVHRHAYGAKGGLEIKPSRQRSGHCRPCAVMTQTRRTLIFGAP